VFAEITEITLQALPGILAPGRDGYDDTADRDPENTEQWSICSSPLWRSSSPTLRCKSGRRSQRGVRAGMWPRSPGDALSQLPAIDDYCFAPLVIGCEGMHGEEGTCVP